MPNDRSEPTHQRPRCRTPGTVLRVLLALLLAAPLLAACSLIGGDDDSEPEPPSYAATPDVAAAVARALDRRAEAVLAGDREAFLQGLARGDRRPVARFRAAQETYFDNLAQLPLGEFRYDVDPASLVRAGDDYWAVVELHLQLEGYDALPVVSRDRYRFRPGAGGRARVRLVSVTDRRWERRQDVRAEPWDRGPVVVRTGEGVLGIFDDGSSHAAAALLGAVERGITDVTAAVPYAWSRSVVLYALGDPAFLESIPPVPGGDPQRVDGVAFPVPVAPDDPTLAGTRLALHPRMLDRAGAERERLLRHELTHVAVGERDDAAPVWLSEGIAEYVSVQPMAPEDRRLPAAAVAAASAGNGGMPTDDTFNGSASGVNYALSWWACEYLARSFDPSVLFGLLDAMAQRDSRPDVLLVDLLGLTEAQLARRAGRLLLATYG